MDATRGVRGWMAGGGAVLLAATVVSGTSGLGPAANTVRWESQSGRQLVESLGCGACHTGVPGGETIRASAPAMGDGAAPLAPAYIFHYMADPLAVRPDIAPARMPRYELDERERLALALFVTNERELRGVDDPFLAARSRHPEADRAEGRALFETLNCAGCHVHPEVAPQTTAPDLGVEGLRVREAWLAGYLSQPVTIRPAGPVPGRGGQMPDFRLAPAEVTAITGFLLEQTAAEVAPWEPEALSLFSMQKAATLLRDRWSCLGCHQLGDDGGRIGPRLDGIAHRLRPEYVRALVRDPAHLAPGTIMPGSFEQPDRLDLIASYLLLRDSPWLRAEPLGELPPLPGGETPHPGEALYMARCAPCHGTTGAGDGFNAPFLPVVPALHGDSATMSPRPDDTLYDGIYAGGWILGKSHRMPAFGASLDDDEIRALVAYIRTLCNCQGPAWSRDGWRGR